MPFDIGSSCNTEISDTWPWEHVEQDENISTVKHPAVDLPRARDRGRGVSRAIRARRHLTSPRGGGRAWINGREVGGADPRYAHLGTVND